MSWTRKKEVRVSLARLHNELEEALRVRRGGGSVRPDHRLAVLADGSAGHHATRDGQVRGLVRLQPEPGGAFRIIK